MYWIVVGSVLVLLIAAYTVAILYARKRQKTFDAQYNAAKERHEVFVLSKKVSKERPKTRWGRYIKVKTYQVVGRVTVSQAIKGMQMSRMQTVTFQTTKNEFSKIQNNHKYKMDIAGNYIGYVVAPLPVKEKPKLLQGKGAKTTKNGKNDKAAKQGKRAK